MADKTTIKKIEKFWSGNCGFHATETFPDLDSALKAGVPSSAATIVVNPKTISYEFKRIKEVGNNNVNPINPGHSIPKDLSADREQGKGKKSS